jgi:hypothetical protein
MGNMGTYEETYEAPELVEVGGFAERTLGAGPTDCVDWFGGDAWIC